MRVTLTSKVCIRFGLIASLISTVRAPLTPYRERHDIAALFSQHLYRLSITKENKDY